MRPRIGNLFEIKLSKGFAYGIFTHRHTSPPKFGCLLRVFDGVFANQAERIQEIIDLPIRFSIFFPLQAGMKYGLLRVVDTIEVPSHLLEFPLFRTGMVNPASKKVSQWWIWDGQKSKRVLELNSEYRKLSIRGIWNAAMLVRRIEEGWRPETDGR